MACNKFVAAGTGLIVSISNAFAVVDTFSWSWLDWRDFGSGTCGRFIFTLLCTIIPVRTIRAFTVFGEDAFVTCHIRFTVVTRLVVTISNSLAIIDAAACGRCDGWLFGSSTCLGLKHTHFVNVIPIQVVWTLAVGFNVAPVTGHKDVTAIARLVVTISNSLAVIHTVAWWSRNWWFFGSSAGGRIIHALFLLVIPIKVIWALAIGSYVALVAGNIGIAGVARLVVTISNSIAVTHTMSNWGRDCW